MTELREPIIIERMRPFGDETRITLANTLASLLQETEIIKNELKEHNREIKRTIAKNEGDINSISDKLNSGLMMKELKVYIQDDDQGRPCYYDYNTDVFLEFVGLQQEDTEIEPTTGSFGDLLPAFSAEKEAAVNACPDDEQNPEKDLTELNDNFDGDKLFSNQSEENKNEPQTNGELF
jgi:hypothetical protein